MKVTLFEDGNFRYTTSFTQGKLLIGRNPQAEINLNSTKVSRRHAVLSVKGNGLQIEDLGSSNGTRINGRAIKLYDLHPDDRVIIGNYELNFHLLADDRPTQKIAQAAGLLWNAEWEDTLEVNAAPLEKNEPTKVTDAPLRRRKSYPPKAG